MGYYGLAYPPEYGGNGAGYLAYALVVEEISRASMTCGAIVAVSILTREPIFRFGNEGHKQEYLVPLTSGKIFACFCFTEPETGSDPKAITTRAKPEGENYIIEGQKNFIALSPVASLAIIFAKDDTGRISAFLSPTYLIKRSRLRRETASQVMPFLSRLSVLAATYQPWFCSPTMFSRVTFAPSKKVSHQPVKPRRLRTGVRVIPGVFKSARNMLIPLCLAAWGSVRTKQIPQSAW